MSKNKDVNGENRILEKTLDSIVHHDEAPKGVFVLLLILYLASYIAVTVTAGSEKVVMFGDNPLSLYTFTGIFSSICNLCVVLMVVFCGERGFITSIALLFVQCPLLLLGIFVRHNYTSIPGIFGIILTVIAVFIIHHDIKKEEKYQLRLREQATTDLLTGLPNGFASTELSNNLIKKGTPFAAATIDINGFKSINDTMGFDKGNKVLIEIGSRWKNIADKGLSGTLDFISRINGDEYSLIIRDYGSEDDIVKTIKQYEDALTEKIHIEGYDFFVNASFGYAVYPEDSDNRDSLFSYSVAAMKEIKRINSSEHILRFSPDLLKSQNLLIIDNKVREAIENDKIFFNLQPQFNMSHELRGFEALARMKDAEGNIIGPDEFIPAAERLGLIDSLDLTVYKKAAAFFGELLRQSGADIILSINVSVKHLMKSDFTDEIRKLLEDSGIPAHQLEIEITESIMIESVEKAAHCLNDLKEMGIRIAIDDFGTGYSSLSYLNSIPSDILKVDKSFIDIMNTSESSKKYIKAIILLGHVMGLEVIAEGVEEEDQLETLRSIHCDYIQGFIWGRPLPEKEAEELVMSSSLHR
ncbi:MAG: EAL domain-containing protein [Lachnospiraceae bacterium]|nr:EAL domain-containing protein [Lachnospiraceae bacterium]